MRIEASAQGLVRAQTHYANSINLQVMENFGRLQVKERKTGKMRPKTYVKVYARDSSGKVRLHKDGYTDLRGIFDYASLSGDTQSAPIEFAILVMSEAHGALVREVAAPVQ